MLLKILRRTGPGVLFLLVLTIVLLWTGSFMHPQVPGNFIYESRPMPLYGLLKMAVGTNPLTSGIIVLGLFGFMLFLLTIFNTSIFFINERTFLPSFFYILFIAIFPRCQVMNPVLPASILLMVSLRRIMDTYRKPGTAYDFFDAGIFIGAGSLFYADFIWFGLLLVAGIILLRSGNFKEIVISLLGLLAPFLITAGIYYLLGKDTGALLSDIKENLFERITGYQITALTIIVLVYSGLILLLGMGFLLIKMNTQKIRSRKTFNLLLCVLAISASLFLFVRSVSVEIIWIAAIPASYILAHYFIFEKKKIFAEIVFTLFVLFVFLVQIIYIF